MRLSYRSLMALAGVCVCTTLWAHIPPSLKGRAKKTHLRGEVCTPSTSQIEMSINNVRTRLLGGGDMWWDLNEARYEIPKVDPGSGEQSVSSIFAGSVWIGGLDESRQLKIAGLDYRDATTNEWWPGPIDPITRTVDKETCDHWDRHFEVYGKEVRKHISDYRRAQSDSGFSYTIEDVPDNIKYWPARGNANFYSKYGFELPDSRVGLGQFYEENHNDIYEPELGEFPTIDIRYCDDLNIADQMIYWIYNDVGNVHTRTYGNPLQMEVQVQAFAFESTDEINDMTFYRYKLINRSLETLDSCFFAIWLDPDLGCSTDDYIGCDSTRSLMYIYNADEMDGGGSCVCELGEGSYCDKVPILGVDYFRGPTAPKVFDSISGELRNPRYGERADTYVEVGMSSFMYYNRSAPGIPAAQSDPQTGPEFYALLSGSWSDGTPLTKGGSGYNIGSKQHTRYAFHDPPMSPGGWSMCEEKMPPGDRRTIQASGPMRLYPHQVNELIVGVVWVPDQLYPCPDLSELYAADKKAQDMFDCCFCFQNGPDAPIVDIIELDQELILVLSNNTPLSNNIKESYEELGLGFPDNAKDDKYHFEGYRIFQVSEPNISRKDLSDPNKAREIATFDLKNGIKKIYNWESITTSAPNEEVYVPRLMVEGTDSGLRHTLSVREDRFTRTTDKRIVNHKPYYFYVVAYAHNDFEAFDIHRPLSTQDRAYLEGRNFVGDLDRNGAPYVGVPRPMVYLNLNSEYGQGLEITRWDGIGNGGNFLEITDETEVAILSGSFDGRMTYKAGRGPLNVKIFNPVEVADGNYTIQFLDDQMTNDVLDAPTTWEATDQVGHFYASNHDLSQTVEEIWGKSGLSFQISQVDAPGENKYEESGLIGMEIEYANDQGSHWLGFIRDDDIVSTGDPGSIVFSYDFVKNNVGARGYALDPLNVFHQYPLLPYIMTDRKDYVNVVSPGVERKVFNVFSGTYKLSNLNNVDLVLTPNKDHWSRCVVLETATPVVNLDGFHTLGDAASFELRQSPSVGKRDMNGDGRADADGDGVGMGWFPGYAIDVETGRRLNVFFGENSAYNALMWGQIPVKDTQSLNMGTDMMWNPSSQLLIPELLERTQNATVAFTGGQHFIYVTNTTYDSCRALRTVLQSPTTTSLKKQWEKITWTGIPILNDGAKLLSYEEGLIPNKVKIKARVNSPYRHQVGQGINGGYNYYSFDLHGLEAKQKAEESDVLEAMWDIRAVPNPYYGHSEYENDNFSKVVKITNLPFQCVVTIFGLDGSFVKQYKRDVTGRANACLFPPEIERSLPNPDLVWNLTNAVGVPVSSGTYLIHVKDTNTGAERVIKWFGVVRQFDPSGLQ